MDKEDTPRELTFLEIIDEHTIRVQEDPTEFATEDGEVFVYGEEVDDFVFLKNDAIFTVAVSALQGVDRQLQQEKARNDRWRRDYRLWKRKSEGFPPAPYRGIPHVA